jgi:hypothetical protein
MRTFTLFLKFLTFYLVYWLQVTYLCIVNRLFLFNTYNMTIHKIISLFFGVIASLCLSVAIVSLSTKPENLTISLLSLFMGCFFTLVFIKTDK